jgi:hypothetical protein
VNGFRKVQNVFARWTYALVFIWPNGCYVSTWSKHIPFECKQKNQGVHLFVMGGLGNKITVL